MSTEVRKPPFPDGIEYFDYIRPIEHQCELKTDSLIAELGPARTACLKQLGTTLSLMYRYSMCYWGCHQGVHLLEMIVGRSVCSASAAIRLIHFGYYDEALSLIRGIGETANLLFLFVHRPLHLKEWMQADPKTRRNKYAPAAVRAKIDELGEPIPMDADDYKKLCEVGTHITPDSIPQAHNARKQPYLGAFPQIAGMTICFDHLCQVVSMVAGAAGGLTEMEDGHPDKEHPAELREAGCQLLRALANIHIVGEDNDSVPTPPDPSEK